MTLSKDNSSRIIIIAAVIGLVGVMCAALIGILPDILDRIPKASATPLLSAMTPTATSLIEPGQTETATPTQQASNGLPAGYMLYDDFLTENSLTDNWQVDDPKRICNLTVRSGNLFFDCQNKTKNDINAAMQPSKLFATISGVLARVTVTEAGGPFQLTADWKCASGAPERAYHLALSTNQASASEFYPQENWRENPLGSVLVSSGQPHLLQMEMASGGIAFLVDGQNMPLDTAPDFPICLGFNNWGFSFFVWKDNNSIRGEIDKVGFKP